MKNLSDINSVTKSIDSLNNSIKKLNKVYQGNEVNILIDDSEIAHKIIETLEEIKADKKELLSNFVNSNEFKEV